MYLRDCARSVTEPDEGEDECTQRECQFALVVGPACTEVTGITLDVHAWETDEKDEEFRAPLQVSISFSLHLRAGLSFVALCRVTLLFACLTRAHTVAPPELSPAT